MSILIFIIILAILVLVHELGHFLAAKKSGVLVEEFGFGFPPRLFSITYKKTIYSINLIPLGGFVKLYGEEYKEKVNTQLTSQTFSYKKPHLKAFIIIAGVIGNFLLGWTLISYLFTQGVPTPTNTVIVEKVQQNTPAFYAGMKERDQVVKILDTDGRQYNITSTTDLADLSRKFGGEEITINLKRGQEPISVKITPRKNPPSGQGPLGVQISSPFVEKKYAWYQAPFFGLVEAARITETIVKELFKTIYQLATIKNVKVDVAGPVGIARFTGEAIKLGKNAVLELMALLSLNLAVVNILPFPALDGGRLVFVLYEWITKKRVNESLEKYLNLVGIILLLTLAGIITAHDIANIFK